MSEKLSYIRNELEQIEDAFRVAVNRLDRVRAMLKCEQYGHEWFSDASPDMKLKVDACVRCGKTRG